MVTESGWNLKFDCVFGLYTATVNESDWVSFRVISSHKAAMIDSLQDRFTTRVFG